VKILITGGAGFIGHHIVEYFLRHSTHTMTLLDRLDLSGNLNRLSEVVAQQYVSAFDKENKSRVRFIYHDLKSPISDQLAYQIGAHDIILHMAAATHVDRSITHPMEFVMDNVVGTTNILDFARKVGCLMFIQFSTDEVFGPAPPGVAYKEDDRYRSGNPYAASKAGAEEMAIAYHNTYGVPVVVTHTMNVVGERQHPEKFVPLVISKVAREQTVTIHADKTLKVSGSRFYIHAQHVAEAIRFIIRHGSPGEKYNICGRKEVSNLELAQRIAEIMEIPLLYKMVDFHSSRPGHDLRYALDGSKLQSMGFVPSSDDDLRLSEIVSWYTSNPAWLHTLGEKLSDEEEAA